MSLQQRDQKHLWHPLTQHQVKKNFLPIVKAKGALMYDDKGNQYIDGIASWYTCMYGHCNDVIMQRVEQQMRQLDQVVFAGFTHPAAIELADELMAILPDNQQKLFFSDNGSTANEVALKMAIQYHHNRGKKANIVIAFDNAFHGDTFGAMSASGLSVYNGPFSDFFIEVRRIEVPNDSNIDEVMSTLASLIDECDVAAFIYEPLVQGANAMYMYEAKYLELILQTCHQHEVITIADEVMTGFGKTGKNFASDWVETKPDMICLSKALTAGLVPMAITSCTQKIYQAFLSDSVEHAFFHAHTYTANPIACSAAHASLKLLKSTEIQNNIKRITQAHRDFDRQLKKMPCIEKVQNTRQLGVIYALDLNIDMQRYGNQRQKIYDFFMQKGVCLRPLGNTVYLVPPYVITARQLQKIYDAIIDLLKDLSDPC